MTDLESSDANLRALGREEIDPEVLARLVANALRRGELPGIGELAKDLPEPLRAALGAARVRDGFCAWCGGPTHRTRSGERACCCQSCFLESGVLCFSCPRRARAAPP